MADHSGTVDCHKSPHWQLDYSVNNDGNYTVKVYNVLNGNSKYGEFGYKWSLSVNGTTVISKSTSEGDGIKFEKSYSGNCGTSFTVTASCESKLGCDMAGTSGTGPHNYTVVSTINLHTHSAPSGGAVHLYDYLNDDNKGVSKYTDHFFFGYDSPKWACCTAVSASKWEYSYDGVNFVEGDSTNKATRSNETPGKSCNFWVRFTNSANLSSTVGPATFRTRYATPTVSVKNGNKLNNNNASVSKSTSSITIDASETTTTNCGTVTYYYSKDGGANYTKSSSNSHTFNDLTAGTTYNISVYATNGDGDKSSGVSLSIRTRYAKPTVALSNANVRSGTNNAAVSNSTNSIKIKATVSGSNIGTSFTYYFKKSTDSDASWVNNGNNSTYTFTGLNPGTNYTLQVVVDTADGSDTRSGLKSITIRTRYDSSNFTNAITINDIGLEHVVFTPSVKYGSATNTIASAKYTITGGNAADSDGCTDTALTLSSNAIKKTTSPYFLTPNTSYTLKVDVTTTDAYDRISYSFNKTFKTDAKSYFSVVPTQVGGTSSSLFFGMPNEVIGTCTIKNPSLNNVKCALYVKNDDPNDTTYNIYGSAICSRTFTSGWDSNGELKVDLSFTENEWDKIYKRMGSNSNRLTYLWRVVTYSNRYKSIESGYIENTYAGRFYYNSEQLLVLNGKMKTLCIGDTNNKVRRAAVFVGVGNSSQNVRRAVIWYGDANGKPHRCRRNV